MCLFLIRYLGELQCFPIKQQPLRFCLTVDFGPSLDMFFFRLVFLTTSAIGYTTAKRGLAFAAGDTPGDLYNANQTGSHVSWIYDWASTPPAYITESHIEYIPMQWGSEGIDRFPDAVKRQGARSILVRVNKVLFGIGLFSSWEGLQRTGLQQPS